jgi:hypothetical protein
MPDKPAHPRLGQHGGRRPRNERPDNISFKYGTSRAYLLARLERDRPDLAADVLAGEASAYSVACELGWAKRRRTVAVHDQAWRPAVIDVKALIG